MEPIEPIEKPKRSNQLPVVEVAHPIVSLARATMSDLTPQNGSEARNIVVKPSTLGIVDNLLIRSGIKPIPDKGPIPVEIFSQMTPAQMLNHTETVKNMSAEELDKIPTPNLKVLVPYMNYEQFRSIYLHIKNNITHQELAQFPLSFQLFHLTYFGSSQVKRIIAETFLSYNRAVKFPIMNKDDVECIQEMITRGVFAEMSFQEGTELPAEIWEIVVSFSPSELSNRFESPLLLFGDALAAIPLDLLEKLIVLFNLDKVETCPTSLKLIESHLRKIENAEHQFPNIITLLNQASAKFANGKSLLSPDTEQLAIKSIELPPLSPELPLTIDYYLNHHTISLKGIEVDLDSRWLKLLETLNTKIASSGVLEKRWTFYERNKNTPLQLFVFLFERIKREAILEKINIEFPKKNQLLWACENLDLLLLKLQPSAKEKFEALLLLTEGLRQSRYPKIIPFRILSYSPREFWIEFKKAKLHLKIEFFSVDGQDGLALKRIPPEIWEMTYIKELRLPHNEITIISPEIKNLKQLEWLNVRNNKLESLPLDIFQLPKLRMLNIENNNNLKVPPEIFRIPQLKGIDCSNCILKEMPNSIQLPNLVIFAAAGCGLTAIPKQLFDSVNLIEINLSHNRLAQIPEEIRKLVQLQTLYLGSNPLGQMPNAIQHLLNLSTLFVDNIEMKALPQWIHVLKRLVVLDLSHNRLTTLPRQIHALNNLRTLNLNSNRFETLDVPLPASLKDLGMERNALIEIPEVIFLLENLKNLKLSENQISYIAPELANLVNLERLQIGNNQLTNLTHVPASLKELDIEFNYFKIFPQILFQHPIELKVRITGNNIPPFVSPNATLIIHGQDKQIGKEKLD